MEWHYTLNGEAAGPVSEDEIKNLVAQGTINQESMVWNETFEDWKPLSETELASSTASATAADAAPASNVVSEANSDFCSVCGKTFPHDELVDINGNNSCAECKPIALRRFQENSAVSGGFNYAGFWVRAGATILDGIILTPVNLLIGFLLGMSMFNSIQNDPGSALTMQVIAQFIQVTISFLYTTLLIWKYGGTLGVLACGLRIVNADGTQISYLKSVGRYFAYILNGFTLGIGFIMVAFDREKRALHDMICETRVIYKNK